MCHHTGDSAPERWELIEATDEADAEPDENPSFAREERDVDVELLDADDD